MDKLTSVRIKHEDGTLSDPILISVFTQNVVWDNTHALIDVLGNIDLTKGTVQQQLRHLFDNTIDYTQLNEYMSGQIGADVRAWMDENINSAGSVVIDSSLTIPEAAAEAAATGNKIETLRSQVQNQIQTLDSQFSSQLQTLNNDTYSQIQTLRNQTISRIDVLSDTIPGQLQTLSEQTEAQLQALNNQITTRFGTTDSAIQTLTNNLATTNNTVDSFTSTINGLTTDVANQTSALSGEIQNVANQIENINSTVESVNLALEEYVNDGYVKNGVAYFVHNGEVLFQITGIGGGGGGGGGDTNNATITVANRTGWLSRTVTLGASCPIVINWSSIEDEMPTGDGTAQISINGILKSTQGIRQGDVTIDIGSYVSAGSNIVKVRISDVYNNSRTINFNVTVVVLSISSTFDSSVVYTDTIPFPYTPVGAVPKTVHFVLDGRQLTTQQTSVSGRQITYVIPAQSTGSHSLKVYFESEINNEVVSSNELYYEFISSATGSNTVIITSPYNKTSQQQYTSIVIPYTVYNPNNLTSEVSIYANNELLSTQIVDRTEQSYTYRAEVDGPLEIKIQSGSAVKIININIIKLNINVAAQTEDLVLYLTSKGRSNRELNPATWRYHDIVATFTNFNWVSDGWQPDSEGIVCLRVSGDARVTIPYKLFGADFRRAGKTIEIEFATRNIIDYDTIILSCFSGGRGLTLTSQRARLVSEQSTISTQYKEDEHIRLTFVAQKSSENRFLMVYINGIPSGVVQYPDDNDFQQDQPVDITIGSNDCTIDIYNIRVYDNSLTHQQVLDNWIADTQNGSLMLERYARNQVYDKYGKIVTTNLPGDLPYFILNAEELPQFKGDKKTISGQYVDPMYPSRSFTFTGCQINVQGTSSAPYARKNYDMQFKNGFEIGSEHSKNYTLDPSVLPFNRFVLKADVASSEGANNVELVKLYNDACPYKTPEMEEDPKVRWGIFGFPIVVFWNDLVTNEVKFLGKYNFNFPKRAPAPYGYNPDSENEDIAKMESWEFQNNVSSLMLFQSDYFNEEMRTDPDTGETKEAWRFDYEARFPSDEWVDYSTIQEFQSFVYSTWRENATNQTLSSPVTYNGVKYTKDTAEYRLAKFKNEFPTYAELDSFIFYYIFTELFLLVDSRAKNLFIGFNGSPVTVAGRKALRKATAQPYDMDTAIGTNNEGTLVYGYNLEDIDPGQIYTGKGSVLWENLRDSYPTEIARMYQTLRTGNILSYNTIEQRFEDHQSKWPEAIWIEDSQFKYLDPLINPDPGKEATSTYLPMLQGSKEQQRKWWLSNRFRYMDSKWHAGDALITPIQLRAYSKGDITVTPYFDIYPTVRYGSHTVSERGTHWQPTTLVCPAEIPTFNDTEIYIFSAPQIAKIGDLSPLKIGLADFSGAINLQEVKIGDASSSYDNTNLYQVSFGSNVLLKKIDIRNCSGLGDTTMEGHSQQTVDISKCSVIEQVYFEGTKITAVTLPNGGILRVLHLPATITNLTLINQKALTDLSVAGYNNISTLRLENLVSSIDTLAILRAVPMGARVRLININWETDDLSSIFTLLNSMRGLDESGNNTDIAQVSGTITTTSTTQALIDEFNTKYPYINIVADQIITTLTYKTWNGSETLKIVVCQNGLPLEQAPEIPNRANTAQYVFTPVGWNTAQDASANDIRVRLNVTSDRIAYAAYSRVVRTYTITWMSGDTVLRTDRNVNYGTPPNWNASMPVDEFGRTAIRWDTDLTKGITGDTVIHAKFIPEYTATFVLSGDDTLSGSSQTLYRYTLDQDTIPVYSGDTPVSIQGDSANFRFVGWSPEPAPIQQNTTYTAQFEDNRALTVQYLNRTIRNYESDTVTTFPPYSFAYASKLTTVKAPIAEIKNAAFSNCNNINTFDLTGTSNNINISSLFSATNVGAKNLTHLILRSPTVCSSVQLTYSKIARRLGAVYVPTNLVQSYKDSALWGRYIIADINEYPKTDFSTITDSWEVIASGSNYLNYPIGGTKLLEIDGTQVYMQLVAKNTDTLSRDHSSKARMTWITKDIYTIRAMNTSGTAKNGWGASQIRNWLREVVFLKLPEVIQNNIKTVDKTYYFCDPNKQTSTIEDTIWIPSAKEIGHTGVVQDDGVTYASVFNSNNSRVKYDIDSPNWWWLRTTPPSSSSRFYIISPYGAVQSASSYTSANKKYGVVFGFCL